MKVIVLPTTGRVTQADLENILTVDAQLARLQELRERLCAGVLARVTSGVPVEAGNRSYDIEEAYKGGVRRQRLVVR